MRYAWLILIAVSLSFAPAPLRGQVVDSPYRWVETRHAVGIFAGYLSIDPGRMELAPSPAPYFGARYDVRFTGPLSGAVAFGLAPSNRTVYRLGPGTDGTLESLGEVNTLVGIGEAGLRFHLIGQRKWHGIAPYLVGSGGVVSDLSSGSAFELDIPTDQFFRFGLGFAVGIGVGSDLYLTERFSLRVEVRDYLWRLGYPGGMTASGSREHEWTHNFAPTLGGTYHF